MNDKYEKQLQSMINDIDKEIVKKEELAMTMKEEVRELKKKQKQIKSLFRKRDTVMEDDILPGQIVEEVS